MKMRVRVTRKRLVFLIVVVLLGLTVFAVAYPMVASNGGGEMAVY